MKKITLLSISSGLLLLIGSSATFGAEPKKGLEGKEINEFLLKRLSTLDPQEVLETAIYNQQLNPLMFSLLIEAGADLNQKHPTRGTTPLRIAIDNENLKIIEMLLKAGADPNNVSYLRDLIQTPPHDLRKGGKGLKIAELLLKYGASVTKKDKFGLNALELAEGWSWDTKPLDFIEMLKEAQKKEIQKKQ